MVASVPLSRTCDKLKFCPSGTEFKRWFDAVGDSLGFRFGTCAHTIKVFPWTFPLSDEWLDALNYFGESEDLWLVGRAEDSTLLLEDLVRGYLENPTRVGLLSWVEVLVGIGCRADLPFDFAENTSVDDSVRLRHLGVLLGSKSVLQHDPIALAGLSAELVMRAGAEKRYRILRVDCLYHHQEGSAWVQSYLRELLRVLPPTDNRVRPFVVGTLIGIFQKKQSPLHSAEESRTLMLPPALADALGEKWSRGRNGAGGEMGSHLNI